MNPSRTPQKISHQNSIVQQPVKVATIFNDHFIKKTTDTVKDIPHSYINPLNNLHNHLHNSNLSFTLHSVTINQIKMLIKMLSNSKACGLDDIDNFLIKISSDLMAPVLTHICNLSIVTCTYPKYWKDHKVIPLYKKDDPLLCSNYRPIAHLSSISKIFEKCIFQQIYDYFEDNNLLHYNQHGFRKNMSTITATAQLYDRLIEAAENHEFAGLLLLDFSSAFDLVNHEILLGKLDFYGFNLESLKFFASYLSNRRQLVEINGCYSNFNDLIHGVPQGSIIGPLFFLIFASDLPYVTEYASIDMYADDSNMCYCNSNPSIIENKLQTDLHKVEDWCMSNSLVLNNDKLKFMLCSTPQLRNFRMSDDLQIKGKLNNSIEETVNHKILGIIFCNNLSWNSHISTSEKNLINQLSVRLNYIKIIAKYTPTHILKNIANALFISKLNYGISIWGNTSNRNIQSLQVIQNKVVRTIYKLPFDTPIYILMNRSNWLSVNQMVVFHSLMSIYKILKTKKPKFLYDKINMNYEHYSHTTRASSRCDIIIPFLRLNLSMNSFLYRSMKLWNDLPIHIRDISETNRFKICVKTYIKENIPLLTVEYGSV